MLYLIGLGLGNAEDVTCKGLAVIQRASRVYLEAYTSILTVGTEALVSKTWLHCCYYRLANKEHGCLQASPVYSHRRYV